MSLLPIRVCHRHLLLDAATVLVGALTAVWLSRPTDFERGYEAGAVIARRANAEFGHLAPLSCSTGVRVALRPEPGEGPDWHAGRDRGFWATLDGDE